MFRSEDLLPVRRLARDEEPLTAATVMPAASGEMQLVGRALAREVGAFRTIIKMHNQRLYRIARSVIRNDSEAEDIVQEAYVRAFAQLGDFRGESSLATWLSRIVINEALGRLRKRRRTDAAKSTSRNHQVSP